MKVLFDMTGIPFFLAHGGARTQILNTAEGLREIGVNVEFARWWDSTQQADLIHVFSVPNRTYLTFAREKGIPVVNSTLFTDACNRPNWRLSLQGMAISTLSRSPNIPPLGTIRSQFKWDTFAMCDRNIVGLQSEVDVLTRAYGVNPGQIRIIPLGLDQRFIEASPSDRSNDQLITTGTITERKRSLELARMAKETGVPICFVGKPYDSKSRYWKEFEQIVDGIIVKHVSHTESVEEMIRMLQTSRGFVLYSDYENWCLSAHEAAACGLPLLLPDQRWSRERFGSEAYYFTRGKPRHDHAIIRNFYDSAPSLQAPTIKHITWREVAEIHINLYQELVSNPSRQD
jgi:glycosyltransferase involved in cell wall biosynthesis